MLTKKSYFLFLSVLIVSLSFSACHLESDTNNDFLIKVDSIHTPAIINSGKPFNVVFYGTVGFNVCYSLTNFDYDYNGNDIDIQVRGTFSYKEGKCPEGIVTINGQELSLTVQLPGDYRIIILQPDNSVLIKQITVVE
jgi:hypothetical protein